MKSKIFSSILKSLFISLLFTSMAFAQKPISDFPAKKHFIGSSVFMLANFLPDPPSFYQLSYGYRFTPKETLIIEAITWEYEAPLGIPYGSSFESDDERFPGYVRDIGIGVTYHRFLYKRLYSSFNITPFYQEYFTPENKKLQDGFQLFLTLRFGYRLPVFKNQAFLEPSIAFTHWPINTNLPESFQKQENKWPNYFLFEPGLNFGFIF